MPRPVDARALACATRPLTMPQRRDTVPAGFERDWRTRFGEFAGSHEDDAGIAGWSASGLASRFRFFRRVYRPAANATLHVDVGCGAGTYARWLRERGLDVIGVDYSHPTLVKARERLPPDIALCGASAARLPFADATFGGATCLGVLQAVPHSAPVVTELARVLKPGGELWIDLLNRQAVAARIDIAKRRLRGRDLHLRYENPAALAAMLEASGLDVVARHWLPLVPSRFAAVQALLERAGTVAALRMLPAAATLASHAVLFHARRRDDRTARATDRADVTARASAR